MAKQSSVGCEAACGGCEGEIGEPCLLEDGGGSEGDFDGDLCVLEVGGADRYLDIVAGCVISINEDS